MSVGKKFQILLCNNIQDSTTSLDSTTRTNRSGEKGFAPEALKNINVKEYDYVMHGIIFKRAQSENNAVAHAKARRAVDAAGK